MKSGTSVSFSAKPILGSSDPRIRWEYVDLKQEVNVCQFLGTEQINVMTKREREREGGDRDRRVSFKDAVNFHQSDHLHNTQNWFKTPISSDLLLTHRQGVLLVRVELYSLV
jgi:hypothetical protein